MVGIRSFPIGFRPIFRCELSVSGRVCFPGLPCFPHLAGLIPQMNGSEKRDGELEQLGAFKWAPFFFLGGGWPGGTERNMGERSKKKQLKTKHGIPSKAKSVLNFSHFRKNNVLLNNYRFGRI